MNEEFEVLRTVTMRLKKANIPYMISGSIAANYYTIPRMTRDIDIVVELSQPDIDRFADLFEEDFYLDRKIIKKEVLKQGMFNLIHNEYVIKVDFIVRKSSSYNETAFSRRKKFSIKDTSMWFISPEDLVISKLNWAKNSCSEVQIRDVQNLMKTVADLDVEYIENWVSKLSLEQIYQKVKG